MEDDAVELFHLHSHGGPHISATAAASCYTALGFAPTAAQSAALLALLSGPPFNGVVTLPEYHRVLRDVVSKLHTPLEHAPAARAALLRMAALGGGGGLLSNALLSRPPGSGLSKADLGALLAGRGDPLPTPVVDGFLRELPGGPRVRVDDVVAVAVGTATYPARG